MVHPAPPACWHGKTLHGVACDIRREKSEPLLPLDLLRCFILVWCISLNYSLRSIWNAASGSRRVYQEGI